MSTPNKKPHKTEDEFDDNYYDDHDPDFADYNDEYNDEFSDGDFTDHDPAFKNYTSNDESDPEIKDPYEIKTTSTPINKTMSFIIKPLTSSDIKQVIDNKLISLSEQLNLNKNKCLLLLRCYKWNCTKLSESYYDNPNKYLSEAGICINPISNSKIEIFKSKHKQIECGICMDDINIQNTFNLECGHITACKSCWIDYLRNAVQTKQCINLTCPTHKCNVIIQCDIWSLFLNYKYKNEFKRYQRFCHEHFIEYSKNVVFCPGKNCSMIYESEVNIAKEICCNSCKYRFCFRCQNESHFPTSCHIANKWISKCSSESENIQWIMAKTKKCPKCRVHIERNQGCNHMTCRSSVGGCGHEFCWLCKGDWKKHGSNTGGYYKCNIYEKNKKENNLNKEEIDSQNARNELERYEFHYTRFDSHNQSSEHAIKQKEIIEQKMHELAEKFKWNLHEAQFLGNAIDEVIQCWHILAWTYPISYYSNKDKSYDKSFNIYIFNEQQSYLERFCDGLQEKLDFDLEKLGDIKIRQSIIDYTRAAKKYRTNIVKDIESVLF